MAICSQEFGLERRTDHGSPVAVRRPSSRASHSCSRADFTDMSFRSSSGPEAFEVLPDLRRASEAGSRWTSEYPAFNSPAAGRGLPVEAFPPIIVPIFTNGIGRPPDDPCYGHCKGPCLPWTSGQTVRGQQPFAVVRRQDVWPRLLPHPASSPRSGPTRQARFCFPPFFLVAVQGQCFIIHRAPHERTLRITREAGRCSPACRAVALSLAKVSRSLSRLELK